MSDKKPEVANSILRCLPRRDSSLVYEHLQPVDLPLRMQLEKENCPIQHAYFLESGFASVVANGDGGRCVEAGMIGNEGMTGLPVIMGAGRWPQETYMQTNGHGHRISESDLRRAMDESPAFRRCVLYFVHVFTVQVARTCLANGRGKLEERLARWLLMAQDRVGGEELHLTHEFLAYMLGVRRPGVSVALRLLEDRGLIFRRRGAIIITDRNGLKENCKATYGVAEAEFERLLG